MKYTLKNILMLLVVTYFYSCNEEKKRNISTPTPYTNEFEQDAPKTLNFTLNADIDTSFKTEAGTKITFTKGQFIDKKGKRVEGKINFQVREYYTISEMLLGKLSTRCDDKIIATDGMFYVNAFNQIGDTLSLNPQKPLLIELNKTDKDSGYYVFYNDKKTVENFNWKKGGRVFVPEVWDTSSVKSFLSKIVNVLSVVELGFINCDKFIDNQNSTEIVATINSDIDVPVFCTIVLKKYKSIVGGIFNGETFNFKNIPLNEEAVLVCVGKVEDKYYLVIKEFTTSKALKLNETMISKTKMEVETELKKLNNLHPVSI